MSRVNIPALPRPVRDNFDSDIKGICDLSLTVTEGYRSAIGWISMLAVDTLIFALTLIKTLRMRDGLHYGLIRVLFRDGAVYYGILVMANVANVLTFLAPTIGDHNRGLATTLANASVLLSSPRSP
ncbi:hypothetical protein BD413DRAFT_11746 [Trametes elegans]|nr:hypothetical protein BD413DRAFT_11746 [Trametes elegans]